MKKIALFAFAGLLSLASCSEDDSTAVNTETSIVGTWKLTSFNMNESFDLNNDGTASTSLISESGCYNNSNIVFNSNGIAYATIEELEINLDIVVGTENTMEYTIACLPGTSQGAAYIVEGNTVTVVAPGEDSLSLTKSGNTLSVSIPQMTSVPVEDTNGEVTYDFIGATLVFTKQ